MIGALLQERARLATERIAELEAEKLKPVTGGNSFWQWQGLRSMPLMNPGVSIGEVASTIEARMEVLGGLNEQEKALVDQAIAQSKLSRVGLDESISPSNPTSGSPKLRRRLAAMQSNVVTMLRATKTAAGLGKDSAHRAQPLSGTGAGADPAADEANEDVRKRLLYTPPAGSLTSSRPMTHDPFGGEMLDPSLLNENTMLRELISENDKLKAQLAEMAGMNQRLMLEHTQSVEEVTMFREATAKRQHALLNAEIPPEAANWPEDAIAMLRQMQAEMGLLVDNVALLQKQLQQARDQVGTSPGALDMSMMMNLPGGNGAASQINSAGGAGNTAGGDGNDGSGLGGNTRATTGENADDLEDGSAPGTVELHPCVHMKLSIECMQGGKHRTGTGDTRRNSKGEIVSTSLLQVAEHSHLYVQLSTSTCRWMTRPMRRARTCQESRVAMVSRELLPP